MNEFTNMYSYLKVISETTTDQAASEYSSPIKGFFFRLMFLFRYFRKNGSITGLKCCSGADPSTTNTPNDTNNDKEDYCRPRPLSEAYSVPPAARPITSLILPGQFSVTLSPTASNPIEANYSIVPAPTPVIVSPSTPTSTISNGLELPLQGYMKMHPAGRQLYRDISEKRLV